MKVKVAGELGIFSDLPTGSNQWNEVHRSNGSDDWAGRKYDLPSG